MCEGRNARVLWYCLLLFQGRGGRRFLVGSQDPAVWTLRWPEREPEALSTTHVSPSEQAPSRELFIVTHENLKLEDDFDHLV